MLNSPPATRQGRLIACIVAAALLLSSALLAAGAQARETTAHGTRTGRVSHRCARLHSRAARRECARSARYRRVERTRKNRDAKSQRRKQEAALVETETAPAPAPVPAPAPSAPCTNTELVPTSSNIVAVREATLCLINQQRGEHGETALVENAKLTGTAQGHSEDMVTRDYFEHTTPSGEEFAARILASGYIPHSDAYEIAENIDAGTLSLATPAATVSAWMNSPGHRANILNGEFRETGVGVVAAAPAYFSEGQAGATYTQDFGVLAR